MKIVIKAKHSKAMLEIAYGAFGIIVVKIISDRMSINTLVGVDMVDAKSLREFFVSLGTRKEMWYGRVSWNRQNFSLTAICEPSNDVRFTVNQIETWSPEEVRYSIDIVIDFAQLAAIGKTAKAFAPPSTSAD